MRKWIAAAVVAILAASAAALAPDIQADRVLAHIKFLASDDLKGRGDGSPELNVAADYVAGRFKDAGLQPGGEGGGWFQPFELDAGLSVGSDNRLTIQRNRERISFTLGKTYYPLAAPAGDTPDSPSVVLENVPLVFAGYGLSFPPARYDDYARIDVTGKAVLIFSHEPQERDPNSRLNGTRAVPQTTLQAKASLARSHGARALIVVSDPTHPVDEAPYSLFNGDPDAESQPIPVLRVRRDEMRPLIGAWHLDEIAAEIDRDLQPRSRTLPGGTITYVEHLTRNRQTVKNVIGVLRGSDPSKATEAVVVGAHYDHVGLGGHLSMAPELTGQIHNGADDNASGTAAVIEMARAAVSERTRFARTLVFIAFAGEERGLLGSAFYATAPVVPIENTVAMLNLDMVGRANGGVDVSGLDLSPSMEKDLDEALRVSGAQLTIRREGPGAGRSDDSSFIAKRVPAINFFTGFHSDYHRPSDDWEKIDAAGTSRVAALALELAARLAARDSRPEFVQPRK